LHIFALRFIIHYNAEEFSYRIKLKEGGYYLDKALIDEILKDIGLEHIEDDESDPQA
jgi:hypothetical protein